jgi:hypothetical protein
MLVKLEAGTPSTGLSKGKLGVERRYSVKRDNVNNHSQLEFLYFF